MNACPECGQEIAVIEPDPGPIEVAELTDSAVEIARINADRDVQLAKIARTQLDNDERAELDALRLEVSTLRGLLEPPEPEPPAEVPIVVTEPEPEPEPDEPAPDSEPPLTEPSVPAPRSGKRGSPWW